MSKRLVKRIASALNVLIEEGVLVRITNTCSFSEIRAQNECGRRASRLTYAEPDPDSPGRFRAQLLVVDMAKVEAIRKDGAG